MAERGDIGKPLYAHTGCLTEREYEEIEKERDRIWSMVYGVANGSGPVSPPEPEYPLHDDAYIG